jgi:hypothetical protein
MMRGAFPDSLGNYPGKINAPSSSCSCNKQVDLGQSGGDPINSFNGNPFQQEDLLHISGLVPIDLKLSYNGQGGQLSILGQNWTLGSWYHILEFNNKDTKAILLHYPDGKVAKFSGPVLRLARRQATMSR